MIHSIRFHAFALAATTLITSAVGAPPALAEVPAASTPLWKPGTIGRLAPKPYLRPIDAFESWNHFVNPVGVIEGEEFYQLAKPMERAAFDRMMTQRGNAPETLERLYQDYLRSLTDQVFSVLVLNRLIDIEAGKRRHAIMPSNTRVYFIARSLVTENAIQRDKVPTQTLPAYRPRALFGMPQPAEIPARKVPTEDLRAKYNDDELYAWLKEAVGERPVRFNVDWSYNNGGLGTMGQELKKSEMEWPQVSLSFPKMPETFKEFQEQVRAKLLPTHLNMTRQRAWAEYVRSFIGSTNRRHLGSPIYDLSRAPTQSEMKKLYDAIRETTFKVKALSATANEIVVAGTKAKDFVVRFNALLKERETQILAELFPAPPAGGTPAPAPTPEEQARIRERIHAYRHSVPGEVLGVVLGEFAASIADGTLQASIAPRLFETNGVDPIADGTEILHQQTRAVFNPMFESMGLFPRHEAKESSGAQHLLFLEKIVEGESRYLDIADSRVRQVLESRIHGVKQAAVFRDAAHELFKYNSFQINTDTCTDPAWPCIDRSPRKMVDAIFTERLLPGETLPANAGGSTMGRLDLLGQVAEISLDLFSKAFTVPNVRRR